MRCFFYDGELKSGIYSTKLLPDSEKSHIFKVLRAKSGTEILLNNGKGSLAQCRIISKNEFEIIQIKNFDKPDKEIDLFVAPPKKNSLDIILKQSAEAGVNAINLLKTERSVSVPEGEKYRQQLLLKLKEACKQAHNPFLPDVSISLKLNQLKDFSKNYDRMFFGSTENCSERYSAVKENKQNGTDNSSNCKKFAWIVGPEGGFSEDEYRILKDIALPIQIGNWIMRVETACIAGIITVRNLYF